MNLGCHLGPDLTHPGKQALAWGRGRMADWFWLASAAFVLGHVAGSQSWYTNTVVLDLLLSGLLLNWDLGMCF